MQQRIYLFDTAKFILIFLVIYGHMLQPNRALSYNCEMYSLIYMFHMPLFIMISGFFSKKTHDNKKFIQEWLRLFETFVVLHLFSLIYKYVTMGNLDISDVLIPGFASWYILSLLCWRMFLQFIPIKWLDSPISFMVGSLIVSLLAGYLPVGGALSIQRTFSMFPFFMLGYFIKQRNCLNTILLRPVLGLAIIILYSFVIFKFNYLGDIEGGKNQFHYVMQCTYCYTKGNILFAHPLVCRFLFFAFSLILSLAVMSVISHKNLGVLTEEGRYTMFYYFWHSVLVRILLMLFASLAIEKSVVCLFVGSLIILGILFLMRRCHIFSYMMHPVSSLRH